MGARRAPGIDLAARPAIGPLLRAAVKSLTALNLLRIKH